MLRTNTRVLFRVICSYELEEGTNKVSWRAVYVGGAVHASSRRPFEAMGSGLPSAADCPTVTWCIGA